MLVEICPNLAQIVPNLDESHPNLVQRRPNLARISTNLAGVGPWMVHLAKTRPKLAGPHRASGRIIAQRNVPHDHKMVGSMSHPPLESPSCLCPIRRRCATRGRSSKSQAGRPTGFGPRSPTSLEWRRIHRIRSTTTGVISTNFGPDTRARASRAPHAARAAAQAPPGRRYRIHARTHP